MIKLAYTLKEAAEAVGMSERSLARAIARGDLVPRYPTRKALLLADDLKKWVENARTERDVS